LNVAIWKKEAVGLFDYSNFKDKKKVNLKVNKSMLVRLDESKMEINEKSGAVLANIVKHHGSYWVFHKNLIDDSHESTIT
jgi:hypothetical protein